MSDNKEFWNDKNVGEFALWYKGLNTPIFDPIAEFKKSKEVSEYEILSFKVQTKPVCQIFNKKESGLFGNVGDGVFTKEQMIQSGHEIHSIRRISDGVIFSIGDTIELFGDYPSGTIDRFEIDTFDKTRITAYNKCGYGKGLSACKKVEPKQKLFTTPTNAIIYEGEDFYYSPKGTLNYINRFAKGYPQPPESFLYFKTLNEAEGYIAQNKPIITTYRELHDFYRAEVTPIQSYEDRIKEFSKAKHLTIKAYLQMVETVAYKCECGRKYHSKQAAKRHEKVCQCWTNPKFKTCKTCKFATKEKDSNGMEHEPKLLQSWIQWKCNNPDFREYHFHPAHKNAPDLNINCLIWRQK